MGIEAEEMQIKHIVILVVYGLVCFIGSLAFVQCESRQAQKAVDLAHSETAAAKGELEAVKAENVAMREIMAKANTAVEHAAVAVQNAKEKADERENILISDTPADWLQCELPSSVQDMFSDYCAGD